MKFWIAALTCLSILGCTEKSELTESQNESKILRIFTWSEYLPAATISEFEKEEGVKVHLDYMSSNEQMVTKLEILNKSSQVPDLIMPSDYVVQNLIKNGLIQRLNAKQMPFLAEFDSQSKSPDYDPTLSFVVPFASGTTGVVVNRSLAQSISLPSALSWKEILENPKLVGKVTLLDDPREILHVGLMAIGKKMSNLTESDIRAAFDYLKAHKKNIRAFTSETRPAIESNDCYVCQAYSGDALSIAKTKPEIEYQIPSEGGAKWTDNLAIPSKAKNPELAYKFMSKILNAQSAKAFTEKVNYRTPNAKAKGLLSAELQGNSTIYPSPVVMERLTYLNLDAKFLSLLDKYAMELKSYSF